MSNETIIDDLEITSAAVSEAPKRVLTEDEITLVKAQETFGPRFAYVKQEFQKLSRKEMIRVFNAVMAYPFEDKSLALVKPHTQEYAVYYYAIEAMEAKRAIVNASENMGIDQAAKEEALDTLVKEAKEQIEEQTKETENATEETI